MSDPHSDADEAPLPDELAQRLLARVVELDAHGRPTTSVARLRDVTRDLGIPDETFDRALRELMAQQSATLRRSHADPSSTATGGWWRRLLRPARGRTVAEEVLVNVGVAAGFFGALGFASRLARLVGGEWPLHASLFVIVNIAAVALARRYRARPVMYVLAVTAVSQAVEYAMHLTFGIRAVQGGPTHWAVMLAAAVAMCLAPILRGQPTSLASPESAPDPKAREDADGRSWWAVRAAARAT